MATCPLTGSTETVISVSVLNVPSWGRRSTPTTRMLSRSLPDQVGSGVGVDAGVAPGEGVNLGVGDAPLGAAPLGYGEGDALSPPVVIVVSRS